MRKNICKAAVLLVLPVLILTACGHTIRLQVERTPTMNTAGIRRIAIMPFGTTASHNVSREMAQYVTATATSRIQALNHFTLVDHTVIEQLRRRNESIEGHVDALFTGQVTRIDVRDNTSQRQVTDRSTGQTRTITTFHREVEIEFNYYFTQARDGSLIGPVSKRGSTRASNEDRNALTSSTVLLRSVIDSQLRLIDRDVVPHIVIESRRLARESSRDKDLKALMKDAESQVRSGSYKIALESYLGIYRRYKNIAAAQNVSILYEALGEIPVAIDFLQGVFSETGNLRVRDDITRLNRILQDRATIAADFGDARSQIEKVAAHASEEIRKAIPQNARVWIYNNSANDNMIAAVIDNITADFIRRGVGIVDRENTALIEAEQRYQMSGYVSDNDFVSIGNAAGASTIVVIGITGTGAARRLQLRVLDIERGIPILQSDTSDAWRL